MHLFRLLLILAASATVAAAFDLDALERATRDGQAEVRACIVPVQRLGRTEVGPAVKLNDEGILLAPIIPALDGREEETPYVLLLKDGTRLTTEIIHTEKDRDCVLLKAPNGLPDYRAAATTGGEQHLDGIWYLRPSVPPALIRKEAVQVHLEHLIKTGRSKTDRCNVSAHTLRAGSPLFDLNGHLLGLLGSTEDDGVTTPFTPLARLKKDIKPLEGILTAPIASELPDLPLMLPTSDQRNDLEHPAIDAVHELLTTPSNDVPVVAIANGEADDFDGIHGVIVSANGQILTKASHLGPSPTVTWKDESYPAMRIAEDEATDLALLLIAATNLPTVSWSDTTPVPGSLLWSPIRITTPPLNRHLGFGILSHTLPAHAGSPLTLHSPEHGTSLGLVLEQAGDTLRVAAVFTNGPSHDLLQQGDILLEVDDHALSSRDELANVLAKREIGDSVSLAFERNRKRQTAEATLGHARLAPPASGQTVENTFILPTVWRSGLPDVFVHDAPLDAWQCGTPLYTRDGRLVGLNIAVASWGRVFALPAPTVNAALKRMRAQSIEF